MSREQELESEKKDCKTCVEYYKKTQDIKKSDR